MTAPTKSTSTLMSVLRCARSHGMSLKVFFFSLNDVRIRLKMLPPDLQNSRKTRVLVRSESSCFSIVSVLYFSAIISSGRPLPNSSVISFLSCLVSPFLMSFKFVIFSIYVLKCVMCPCALTRLCMHPQTSLQVPSCALVHAALSMGKMHRM